VTSTWGFLWGSAWGSATLWNSPDPDALDDQRAAIPPGDLDAVATAIERIWKQYDVTETWVAYATALGGAFGDVEQVTGQFEVQRYVGTAVGTYLDQIGALVNLPRSGWTTDDDYRLAIIAEALSRVTSGAADEIIDVAIRIAPDGATVQYREPAPASFVLTVPDLDPNRWALMLDVMADMPPAGVGAWLETWSSSTTAGWDYAASPGSVSPVASWSYSGGGTAGVLAPWSYRAAIG
jgi:hypothetical protein